jgi:hypothetical protein
MTNIRCPVQIRLITSPISVGRAGQRIAEDRAVELSSGRPYDDDATVDATVDAAGLIGPCYSWRTLPSIVEVVYRWNDRLRVVWRLLGGQTLYVGRRP